MEIYWEGTRIDTRVDALKCLVREGDGGKSDALEVEFDRARDWFRWAPQPDDRVEVRRDGYSSGVMYLREAWAEGDRFRALATSLPARAGSRRWAGYRGMTLEGLGIELAAECGMGFAAYGVGQGIRYPFFLREDEGAAAALARLAGWEGAVLKAVNGQMRMIDLDYAAARTPVRRLEITAGREKYRYFRRELGLWRSLTVDWKGGEALAWDENAPETGENARMTLPAGSAAEAGRWARALLAGHNREQEALEIELDFDPGMYSLARVDVSGGTGADGRWLVRNLVQDLAGGWTRVEMRRA